VKHTLNTQQFMGGWWQTFNHNKCLILLYPQPSVTLYHTSVIMINHNLASNHSMTTWDSRSIDWLSKCYARKLVELITILYMKRCRSFLLFSILDLWEVI
jgi:hypothetical protein